MIVNQPNCSVLMVIAMLAATFINEVEPQSSAEEPEEESIDQVYKNIMKDLKYLRSKMKADCYPLARGCHCVVGISENGQQIKRKYQSARNIHRCYKKKPEVEESSEEES